MNKFLRSPKKTILPVILLASLLITQKPALAWRDSGHQTVALIAQDHVKPETKKKIDQILGSDTGLDKVSICADDIKHNPVNCANKFQLGKRVETHAWHYINIPLSEKNPTVESIQKYCKNDDCINSQIKNTITILHNKDSSKLEKQTALMFLVHFIGDIHQPLHCIDDNDRGGNDKVIWLYSNKPNDYTNLHSLWDNIIEDKIDSATLTKNLEKDISTKKDLSKWLSGDTDEWVLESYNIGKDLIYPDFNKNGGHLNKSYQRKMRAIAYQQIEKGG
ncbi:MAG: hypothetical protein H7263_14425, partial [Candidatus Sericytochromatia bacterium]|nr:hypothetical protein [Candidatus Sericytochromatia bacterium]